MATEALDMVTQVVDMADTSKSDLCDVNKEIGLNDDTNNNAQEKVLPRLPIFKDEAPFTPKAERHEIEDSPKALIINETPTQGDLVASTSTKKISEAIKTDQTFPPHPLPPHPDSNLVKEMQGNSPGISHGRGFSSFFFSSLGIGGSKPAEGQGRDLENIPKQDGELGKNVSSQNTMERPVPCQIPMSFDGEGSGKMRQKGGGGGSQGTSASSSIVKPRCTPAREAVDPAKYFTLTDEPDGTKYACSKCGNVYKWRKSLNKHWKEKHDGETPSLHARPPPSLIQRERYMNPLRSTPKHSVFHQPGFHGSSLHAKSSAGVISPPRVHMSQSGKNSSYVFGKFPIKDDGRDFGKMIHQHLEEAAASPATAPQNRSTQSPGNIHGWGNWYNPNRPILDFPPQMKLNVPTVGSIKSAHEHTQAKDNQERMFSAIQSHHTLRGGPLDLSGTIVSQSVTVDDTILDLSCKGPEVLPAVEKRSTTIQDEPLDFSVKPGKSSTAAKTTSGVAADFPFTANWFSAAERKVGAVQKAVAFPDNSSSENLCSVFSIHDFEKQKPPVCAGCHQVCSSIMELNHHFARVHMNMIYEAAVDLANANHRGSAGHHLTSPGGTQLYKYLTAETSKRSLACIVCGMTVQWSWMLSKHFEQMHGSIQPNPYKKPNTSSSSSSSSTTTTTSAAAAATQGADSRGHSTPTASNHHRCDSCSFTTESVAEFARHQLKHSLTKEKKEKDLPESISLCIEEDGTDRDEGSSKRPSDSPFEQFADGIIDLEGESTAIVIPQAPEDTCLGTPLHGSLLRTKVKVNGMNSSEIPTGFSELSLEDGTLISGENTAIVIPQAPEETSMGSSGLYITPPGSSKNNRGGKKETTTGSSAESLLPFKCELCEYRARWPSEMMQHMKNHSDEKPYQCPQCSYRSKWKWDVVKHLKRCGGGGTVKDVIDTTTQKKRSYVKSLLIDSHSHPGCYDDNPGMYHSSMNFRGMFDPQCSLKGHDPLSKGPPNVTIYSTPLDMRGSPTGGDNCENCDSEDEISEDLSIGRMEQGGETSVHGCPHCPFVGHSPAELKRHLRVHSDEKPYTCQSCCYSSKWKCDLKKHLKAYNHVSAVPLIYGGHGRKPMSWSHVGDSGDGRGTEGGGGEIDLRSLLQVSSRAKKGSENGQGSERPQSQDSGSIFGGITSGGRLRCKQCEFEAIDITSFLQHKKIHRNPSLMFRKHEGNTTKDKSLLPSYHHRRKSFRQTRVPQVPTKKMPSEMDGKVDSDAGLEENGSENRRFWESLGLRSTYSVNHGRQSSESSDVEDDRDSSDIDADSLYYGVKRARYHFAEQGEYLKQSSGSDDSCESNTDTEVDYMETSGELNLCQSRTRTPVELGADPVPESVKCSDVGGPNEARTNGSTAILKQPCPVVRRGIRQGVTTTEAEDAAGMSKRKRKLRTCEKCGYITDNLTTLQRHAAKHGSGGRHRCWKCDYSVDRQHVLDYHVKIVHEGAGREVDNKAKNPEKPSSEENRIFENPAPSSAVYPTSEKIPNVDRGSFGGKRKIVCTTRVITVRGHRMEMIQKGTKIWYNCIKCHFVSSNITNAVNHAKQHGANKKYKCKHCDYSLDRKSSIANHMNSQHAQPGLFHFDFESGGKDPEKMGVDEYMVELPRKEGQGKYLLLDKMSFHRRNNVCVKCGYCSINYTLMVLHRLSHGYMDKAFPCTKCNHRATTSRLLTHHMTSHDLEDAFCCSNCPYKTYSSVVRDDHIACHSGNFSNKCGVCSFTTESVDALKEHSMLHGGDVAGDVAGDRSKEYEIRGGSKLRCPSCPYKSANWTDYIVHCKHHNSSKKLGCGQCSFRTNIKNVLYHHQRLHCRKA